MSKNGALKLDNNLLSIDLGYSATKYYFKVKDKEYYGKIDNAVLKLDNDTARDDFLILNQTKYAIGQDIVGKGLSELSLSVDDLIKYSPLFVAKIIIDNNIDHKDLNIVTGLSFKDIDKSEKLTETLSNFIINDSEYSFKVDLLPQGRGIAYDYDNNHKDDNSEWKIVMDIGYHTFDFISIYNNKLDRDDTFANNQGVNLILNEIVEELNKKGCERNTAEINKLLYENKNSIKYRGDTIDISEYLNTAIENYFNKIKNLCNQHKTAKERLDRADIIILGGGGAYLFENKQDIINKVFNAKITFIDKPYEFSNARGYYIRNLEVLRGE